MKIQWLTKLAVFAALSVSSTWAWADGGHQNRFASILLDGKKIGHVHYSVKHNDQGELEELRTKASLSLLGVKLYDFSQHLHEQWSGGELQTIWGSTNDDGVVVEATLERTATDYNGSLNGEPLTLPHEAFPISLWHYAVTRKTLLFDLADLRLLNVNVSEHEDSVAWGGETVHAMRYDFTGDWKGSVWFDDNEQFVKAEYVNAKRLVTVVMDP